MDLLQPHGTLGTLWGMQAVFPPHEAQGWGRIVNVGSSNGIRGAAGYGPYKRFERSDPSRHPPAAREWANTAFVANCYCPAAAARGTNRPTTTSADALDAMYRRHPMSRDGEPEDDIAPVVLFLCSDASRFLNGETLMIDGGGYMTA